MRTNKTDNCLPLPIDHLTKPDTMTTTATTSAIEEGTLKLTLAYDKEIHEEVNPPSLSTFPPTKLTTAVQIRLLPPCLRRRDQAPSPPALRVQRPRPRRQQVQAQPLPSI